MYLDIYPHLRGVYDRLREEERQRQMDFMKLEELKTKEMQDKGLIANSQGQEREIERLDIIELPKRVEVIPSKSKELALPDISALDDKQKIDLKGRRRRDKDRDESGIKKILNSNNSQGSNNVFGILQSEEPTYQMQEQIAK